VPHALEDVADQHVALCRVRLGEHPILAVAVAGDAHKPGQDAAASQTGKDIVG
jgi:hypothetical protein